jgi:hypothetical protein
MTAQAWWDSAPEIFAECCHPRSIERRGWIWYAFAKGWLGLDCDDEALLARFQEIYPEGAVADPTRHPSFPAKSSFQVKCQVFSHPALRLAAVTFDDPEPLDPLAFCRSLFPDRGYVDGPAAAQGWRTIALRDNPSRPLIAMNGNSALVDRRQVWQPFVANYAVNRVLRLQKDMLFFHAASVAIEGRGIMIVGPKGTGKTTTSMTLASRGRDFLGDEMAAVQQDSKALFPFRRAASLRAGPRARRVDEQLAGRHYSVERFPDGGERILVNIGGLFPQAGVSPATLCCVMFLRRFADRPAIEPFAFGREHFCMLSPLACSMWGRPVGAVIMNVSRLLRGTSCYYLDPGPPEETADLVEQVVRGRSVN